MRETGSMCIAHCHHHHRHRHLNPPLQAAANEFSLSQSVSTTSVCVFHLASWKLYLSSFGSSYSYSGRMGKGKDRDSPGERTQRSNERYCAQMLQLSSLTAFMPVCPHWRSAHPPPSTATLFCLFYTSLYAQWSPLFYLYMYSSVSTLDKWRAKKKRGKS